MSEDAPIYPTYGPYRPTPEWRREVEARVADFDLALALALAIEPVESDYTALLREQRQTCVDELLRIQEERS